MPNPKAIRRKLCQLHHDTQDGHLGCNLSMVEIVLEIKKQMNAGDKFILSKQHCYKAIDVIGAPEGYVKELHNLQNLGNGIGIGLGMAIANPNNEVYVLCGDGELDEGSCWEAIHYIYKNNINNVHIYIDCNGYGAYQTKHWGYEISDEYDFINICYTVKGKGVSFLEDTQESHYKVLTQAELNKALKELE